ncbi:hypothetical protein PCAR4_110093 [Paraburkholderia caribensis]|nr:hypothetical protein PCAR4_110093 [Paraburkholderia caribensis]
MPEMRAYISLHPFLTGSLQMPTQNERLGGFVPGRLRFPSGHRLKLMLELFDNLAVTAAVKAFD